MSSKRNLPDVTLVCCETRDHALARLAVQDCVTKVQFGDVLIFTNEPRLFEPLDCEPRYVIVEDFADKLGWCRYGWFGVPEHVRTSMMCLIQWDSGVWDTSMWTDEFMEYDYIGAVWGWHKTKKVGNSGFGLKSIRLARYIADRAWEFPCSSSSEDDLLCRKYRPVLEERGFRWAPERLAHKFSFECTRPDSTSRHFGYHAMFNWPIVLPHDEVLHRLDLAFKSAYIRDSYMMKAFCQMHPAIAAELRDKHAEIKEGEACLPSVPT
jgi:Protein of unknown function (DUF5672)